HTRSDRDWSSDVCSSDLLGTLGAADYLWQRRRHEERLRMTRQEVREEQKESEGDPQVRQRFRRAHREIARRRMLAEVPRADVVRSEERRVGKECRGGGWA